MPFLPKFARVLKKGGTLVIWNKVDNLGFINDYYANSKELIWKGTVQWLKTNPMPRNRDRRYINSFELASVFIKKGTWTFNRQRSNYENGVFEYPIVSGKKRIHPTQKSLELMEDLIKIHSNKDDIVLDCFMGSGTTGEACKNLDRKFIGVELDKDYFNKAKDRIFENN